MILVDLDDLTDTSVQDIALLDMIKSAIPTFKATLFAIPSICSAAFIHEMKVSRPWLDLVPHGWNHNSNRECQSWTMDKCLHSIESACERGLTTKGFKAPGWQISDGCYAALEVLGYWVADQEYNDWRRPSGLRSYVIRETGPTMYRTEAGNSARAIHGHISHRSGHNANALELIYDQVLEAGRKDPDFRFIDEVMR